MEDALGLRMARPLRLIDWLLIGNLDAPYRILERLVIRYAQVLVDKGVIRIDILCLRNAYAKSFIHNALEQNQ